MSQVVVQRGGNRAPGDTMVGRRKVENVMQSKRRRISAIPATVSFNSIYNRLSLSMQHNNRDVPLWLPLTAHWGNTKVTRHVEQCTFFNKYLIRIE